MPKKPLHTTQWRHCPGCRRARLTKQLGDVTVRGEHLLIAECTEPTCALRWCVTRRTVQSIGVAA